MVAWWLRAMALCNGVGLLVWLGWAWPRSVPVALAGALLWLLGGRLWIGAQFVCMALVRRRSGETLLPAAALWRAWNAECRVSLRAFGWDMAWAEDEQADYLPPRAAVGAPAQAGVVLVHGWLCNRAAWSDALHQLRAAGVPCMAVSMPMLLHRIGTGRAVLDAAARRMQAVTGLRPVVVAHSMGGLVVRDWLRSLPDADAPQRPAAVVTVGSPHQGSWLAYCAWGPNAAQMRLGNAWLQQLAREEAQPGSAAGRVRWHCAVSEADNIVFPSRCCLLAGAQPLWLHGLAHMEMLQAPALWALVRSVLAEAAAAAGPEAAMPLEAASAHGAPGSIM